MTILGAGSGGGSARWTAAAAAAALCSLRASRRAEFTVVPKKKPMTRTTMVSMTLPLLVIRSPARPTGTLKR